MNSWELFTTVEFLFNWPLNDLEPVVTPSKCWKTLPRPLQRSSNMIEWTSSCLIAPPFHPVFVLLPLHPTWSKFSREMFFALRYNTILLAMSWADPLNSVLLLISFEMVSNKLFLWLGYHLSVHQSRLLEVHLILVFDLLVVFFF